MHKTVVARSPYERYCVGYENPGVMGRGYYMGLALGVGVVKNDLGHAGSSILDEILAFDRAEVEETCLGQINMITVSSFCGLQGRVWGLDLAKEDDLEAKQLFECDNIPVFTAAPLLMAAKKLFGTVRTPNFPLLPGTHVPCAAKSIVRLGGEIYAALALGVPRNRQMHACLMMEDVGEIHGVKEQEVFLAMARSIVAVGHNQGVDYEKIFVGWKRIVIPPKHTGCALVAAPYFALARDYKIQ